MLRERQVSFAAGEISPELWGRSDLDTYHAGARSLENFLVSPSGVAVNRSGTVHLRATETGNVRLVGGVRADGSPYLLAFSSGRLDIYKRALPITDGRGWSVGWDGGNNGILHLEQSFTGQGWASNTTLRVAQIGDIVLIACGAAGPYKLQWDGSVWALYGFSTNAVAVADMMNYSTLEGLQVAGTWGADTPTLYAPAGDGGDHPAREWKYMISRVFRDPDGRTYETTAMAVNFTLTGAAVTGAAVPTEIAVYADWPQRLQLGMKAGDYATDLLGRKHTLLATRVYRARLDADGDGVVGYIGATEGRYFADDGADPDYSTIPPLGTNPFEVYEGTVLLRTERPLAVAAHNGRVAFGGTQQRPSIMFMSAVDAFTNFDAPADPDDADALSFEIVSSQLEQIRDLLSHGQLLAFTGHGVWEITGGGDGDVLSPNSIAARKVSSRGMTGAGAASEPAPILVGEAVLYVDRTGATPLMLARDASGGWSTHDLSGNARHLFNGRKIVAWAYAAHAMRCVWVALDDGSLLSLTLAQETGVAAWARHSLAGGGLVRSIAVCPSASAEDGASWPETLEDEVFLCVERGGAYSLEMLAPRVLSDVAEGVFLDRCAVVEAAMPASVSLVEVGLGDSGELATEDTYVDFTPAAPAAIVAGMGLRCVIGGTTYTVRFTAAATATRWLCEPVDYPGEDTVDVFGSFDPADVTLLLGGVDGLAWLDGETVGVVADGDAIDGLAAGPGGAVDLGGALANRIVVGLPYTSDLESLDAPQEKGRTKLTRAVVVELEYTRGGYVGRELSDGMAEIRTREVSDSYATLVGKRVDARVLISDRWALAGRVAIRHTAPHPMTVLGFTREVEHGG